jgi:hypoxanthine phosphoribosyltransferase
LSEAIILLARAIIRDTGSVDHVVGVANGGTAPAKLIAPLLGIQPFTVQARHNRSDATYLQATGNVEVDPAPLRRGLNGRRLTGSVLLVDDICGSGATLRALRGKLAPLTAPGAEVLAATLCLNTGATTLPDYSIWEVSDWVVFPWEAPPAGHNTAALPTPTAVTRHA